MYAIADAFNEEYHELADAGCPVIQIEEPQIHMIAARKVQDSVITPKFIVDVFNRTVKGLRAKTEVWAHSCWAIRLSKKCSRSTSATSRRWRSTIRWMPTSSLRVGKLRRHGSGGDLQAITDKKNLHRRDRSPHPSGREPRAGGGADPRRAQIRPAERLMVSTDCGMGREGMSRRHAFYKAVAITLGTNIVRKELGVRRRAFPRPTSAIRWWLPAK